MSDNEENNILEEEFDKKKQIDLINSHIKICNELYRLDVRNPSRNPSVRYPYVHLRDV